MKLTASNFHHAAYRTVQCITLFFYRIISLSLNIFFLEQWTPPHFHVSAAFHKLCWKKISGAIFLYYICELWCVCSVYSYKENGGWCRQKKFCTSTSGLFFLVHVHTTYTSTPELPYLPCFLVQLTSAPEFQEENVIFFFNANKKKICSKSTPAKAWLCSIN